MLLPIGVLKKPPGRPEGKKSLILSLSSVGATLMSQGHLLSSAMSFSDFDRVSQVSLCVKWHFEIYVIINHFEIYAIFAFEYLSLCVLIYLLFSQSLSFIRAFHHHYFFL